MFKQNVDNIIAMVVMKYGNGNNILYVITLKIGHYLIINEYRTLLSEKCSFIDIENKKFDIMISSSSQEAGRCF